MNSMSQDQMMTVSLTGEQAAALALLGRPGSRLRIVQPTADGGVWATDGSEAWVIGPDGVLFARRVDDRTAEAVA